MNNIVFSSFQTISKDGTQLHGHYLAPSSLPAAIIYFVHGLGGHSGRFLPPASLFARDNIASIGIDLRGNGLSEGKKGHAQSLEKYFEDMDACIDHGKKLFPETAPKIIMGNSMGGAVALQYAIGHNKMFSGVILTAPWLELTKPIDKLKLTLMSILNKVGPKFTFSSKVKPAQEISEITKPEETDPLIHKKVTARLLMSIHKLGINILNNADCYIPTLILHSVNDPVTAYNASKKLCDKHALSCKLITLDYHTHEVPFEQNNTVYKEAKKHIDKILVAHEQLQD